MKITELDLKTEGKRYKCGNSMFVVKNGDLFDIEMYTYLKDESLPLAELLELDFKEVKETKNPYKQAGYGNKYYSIFESRISLNTDSNHEIDNKLFSTANYFNNKEYAEYIAFKETLTRRMDKFAWEHNAKAMNWDDNWSTKYCIIFSHIDNELIVRGASMYMSNNVYFTSHEIAEKAMEEFKDDLIKLYTWKFDF